MIPEKYIIKKRAVYKVTCPYCNVPALLVDSAVVFPASRGLIYLCFNWPECDARVGCHGVSHKPLGTPARKLLRGLRIKTHAVLDPFWKEGHLSRCGVYNKLAKAMGIPFSKCHIGLFNEEQCQWVIDFLKTEGFRTIINE